MASHNGPAAIKREEDDPISFNWNGVATQAPPVNTTSTDTSPLLSSKLDMNLASNYFHFRKRLCLVNIGGENAALWWPALRYSFVRELVKAVTHDMNTISTSQDVSRLQRQIVQHGQSGSCGIAYLIGRGSIEQSLVTIIDNNMWKVPGEAFYSLTEEPWNGEDEDYDFWWACSLVRDRLGLDSADNTAKGSNEEDDDEDDDDVTIPLESPPSPLDKNQKVSTSPKFSVTNENNDSENEDDTIPSPPTTPLLAPTIVKQKASSSSEQSTEKELIDIASIPTKDASGKMNHIDSAVSSTSKGGVENSNKNPSSGAKASKRSIATPSSIQLTHRHQKKRKVSPEGSREGDAAESNQFVDDAEEGIRREKYYNDSWVDKDYKTDWNENNANHDSWVDVDYQADWNENNDKNDSWIDMDYKTDWNDRFDYDY